MYNMEENNNGVDNGTSKHQKKLTAEQYHILREKGTEPAFSGNYYNTKGKGDGSLSTRAISFAYTQLAKQLLGVATLSWSEWRPHL